MKLYTEEQVRSMLDKMEVIYSLEDLTPIEVLNNDTETNKVLELYPLEFPSDEEIENGMNKRLFLSDKHLQFNTGAKAGFKLGAKWMKEQILNQNK